MYGPPSDLPPDLLRLRALETWHAMWLDRIRAAIAAAEEREAGKRRAEEHRPPPPDWVVQLGIGVGQPPVAVHAGGCPNSGKRWKQISRDEARRLLDDSVTACTLCTPDRDLGML
ncbi:hypothetical protein J7I98_38145 [Streptomyces sp. ISL-98]|uniref:DUF6233 domain-containing protein n=1 Tax=Streptomyces sp. ISL-98 TaxID=2819192 RepID=UPI001BE5A18D|nr:DUF6233 domain-containing protein [Streptomyces sp. ISL-98]MBT2511517.1 hypothetical protein [Streptomyces sp. ISL-98]